MIYCDTSFMVSLYQQDANTLVAIGMLSAAPQPIALSMFHELELTNAFEQRIFRGRATAEELAAGWQMVSADLAKGALARVALGWNDVFAHATLLAAKQTRSLGSRSLDILHVASVLDLGLTHFYTFDKRQADLARAEGLQVFGC